jgi:RNA polymerase sigma factor (sigma-70 family)
MASLADAVRPRVRSYLRRARLNPDFLDEAVADVIASVLVRAAELPRDSDPEPILLDELRAVRRRYDGIQRHEWLVPEATLAILWERSAHPDRTAADPPTKREFSAALAAAFRELPAKQRRAVVLRVVDGRVYRTVARAIGSSVGSARAHVCYGLRKLRAALAMGFPPPDSRRFNIGAHIIALSVVDLNVVQDGLLREAVWSSPGLVDG